MCPAAALDRIVYLLDRSRGPSYRVRAFLGAKAALATLAPDELAARIADGTLEELPGIGPVSRRVIEEAARGEIPSYVRRLEGDTEVPITDAGRAVRTALKGDCHVHSNWSDGGAEIEAMARAARGIGHDYIVLTDHSARLTVAHGLDRDRLLAQLEELERLNAELAPFRVLSGMEVDILLDGQLDLDEDLLARLDVVVASVHSKLRMGRDEMTARMVRAMTNPHTDILGHCTGRIVAGRGRPQSAFDADAVFSACADHGKAVEINCRPERQDPPDDLLDLALVLGCSVAIDTDAHAPGQLEWQAYGCDKAAAHGIPTDRIVNAKDTAELVAWAAAH
jgi:putative hydrolase